MVDREHQSGGRMLPGVHNLEHHTHLFGRRAWNTRGRPEDLEHIARRDPFGTTAIDEEDLLEVGQVVQVTGGHDMTLKTLLDRRGAGQPRILERLERHRDRKSTRLNSSHGSISYAVFCLKKK